MPKFMNDELIKIRDNLKCGHCNCTFIGSDSQAWKVKYESRAVYCSAICRKAGVFNKVHIPIPNRGPCKTCGENFFSRKDKPYCSTDCYLASDQFKEMIHSSSTPASPEIREKIAATKRKGSVIPCKECEKEFYRKRCAQKRARNSFCSTPCYRTYLAKRFDRFIANPEKIALPQCYDEFLDQEVLSCLIEGCDWKGKHLSLHVNQAHGVTAADFKRATGFNLSSGIVCKPTAIKLCEREHIGLAFFGGPSEEVIEKSKAATKAKREAKIIIYRSLEGKEHSVKARVLSPEGPERICLHCKIKFRQSTPFGKALYCTVACRDIALSEKRKEDRRKKGLFIRERYPNGTFKWIPKS